MTEKGNALGDCVEVAAPVYDEMPCPLLGGLLAYSVRPRV